MSPTRITHDITYTSMYVYIYIKQPFTVIKHFLSGKEHGCGPNFQPCKDTFSSVAVVRQLKPWTYCKALQEHQINRPRNQAMQFRFSILLIQRDGSRYARYQVQKLLGDGTFGRAWGPRIFPAGLIWGWRNVANGRENLRAYTAYVIYTRPYRMG